MESDDRIKLCAAGACLHTNCTRIFTCTFEIKESKFASSHLTLHCQNHHEIFFAANQRQKKLHSPKNPKVPNSPTHPLATWSPSRSTVLRTQRLCPSSLPSRCPAKYSNVVYACKHPTQPTRGAHPIHSPREEEEEVAVRINSSAATFFFFLA